MTIEVLQGCLLLALGIEAVAGYPPSLYRTIGHPVTWIGALITWLETHLNRLEYSALARKALGVAALVILIAVPTLIAWALQTMLLRVPYGSIPLAILASSLVASRSLYTHVRDVAQALKTGGLEAGRIAVARIVGRDTAVLDEAGVARAAIESLAENASDGIVAPVVWFLVLGLPGMAAYKAINTADSMIGHRTPRYEAFGWAAARLDDLVNLPASRLTGILVVFAAAFTSTQARDAALLAIERDAKHHRSPNAGWPESAMAGALDLKLAGPRSYQGAMVDDAYMGDGRREATVADIDRALALALTAWALMCATIVVLITFVAFARG